MIGAVADPSSRTYSVKIDLPNPRLQIRPGMIADARLTSSHTTKALTLAGNAVLRDDDQSTYVFVADPQKKQAFKRKVTVGKVFASDVEITSGLSANDLIVTGGQQKLQNGSSIQFNQPAQ